MDEKNFKYNFFLFCNFFCNYKKIIVSFKGLTTGPIIEAQKLRQRENVKSKKKLIFNLISKFLKQFFDKNRLLFRSLLEDDLF